MFEHIIKILSPILMLWILSQNAFAQDDQQSGFVRLLTASSGNFCWGFMSYTPYGNKGLSFFVVDCRLEMMKLLKLAYLIDKEVVFTFDRDSFRANQNMILSQVQLK